MPMSPEARARQAERLRARWADPEARQKLQDGLRAAWVDNPERKQQLSELKTGNTNCVGLMRSEEERAAISKRMKGNKHGRGNAGKVHSEEQKQAHSERMKGRKQTHETIAKRVAATKRAWERKSPEEKAAHIAKLHASVPDDYAVSSLEKKVHDELQRLRIEFTPQPFFHYWVDGEHQIIRPDIVIADRALVLEVQGCYYHGCSKCYPDGGSPKASVAGDERRRRELEELGYRVEFLWEHDLKLSVDLTWVVSLAPKIIPCSVERGNWFHRAGSD